jgi:hypothetical protein
MCPSHLILCALMNLTTFFLILVDSTYRCVI